MGDISDIICYSANSPPTDRQVRFYKRLFALCKENGISTKMNFYTVSRGDYMVAIKKLIERLKEHGIDVTEGKKRGGGKCKE